MDRDDVGHAGDPTAEQGAPSDSDPLGWRDHRLVWRLAAGAVIASAALALVVGLLSINEGVGVTSLVVGLMVGVSALTILWGGIPKDVPKPPEWMTQRPVRVIAWTVGVVGFFGTGMFALAFFLLILVVMFLVMGAIVVIGAALG